MNDIVKERERKRRWREAHAEEKKRADAEYRLRNAEKVKEAQRLWALKHPDRLRFSRAIREMNQRKVSGRTTIDQLAARWAYYGGRCWMCRMEATEVDHVKPVAFGGSNWPSNLRPICKPCNRRKSSTWSGRHTSDAVARSNRRVLA